MQNLILQKQGTHRALDDIRESVAELRFYREHVFLPVASTGNSVANDATM